MWPSDDLKSVYGGWIHGGIVNGAVSGRDGYPPVSNSSTVTAKQVEMLKAAQPQALIGHPDWRLVVHDMALPSSVIRTASGRIDPADTGCYAELIVDDIVFQEDVINGRSLKMSLRYRDFGNASTPARVFGTWVKTSTTPIGGDQGQENDDAKMVSAYRGNLMLFGKALQASAAKARKSKS